MRNLFYTRNKKIETRRKISQPATICRIFLGGKPARSRSPSSMSSTQAGVLGLFVARSGTYSLHEHKKRNQNQQNQTDEHTATQKRKMPHRHLSRPPAFRPSHCYVFCCVAVSFLFCALLHSIQFSSSFSSRLALFTSLIDSSHPQPTQVPREHSVVLQPVHVLRNVARSLAS